jgi:hypothetical protein
MFKCFFTSRPSRTKAVTVCSGSIASFWCWSGRLRFTPINRHSQGCRHVSNVPTADNQPRALMEAAFVD